jgi:hypothetical protein
MDGIENVEYYITWNMVYTGHTVMQLRGGHNGLEI